MRGVTLQPAEVPACGRSLLPKKLRASDLSVRLLRSCRRLSADSLRPSMSPSRILLDVSLCLFSLCVFFCGGSAPYKSFLMLTWLYVWAVGAPQGINFKRRGMGPWLSPVGRGGHGGDTANRNRRRVTVTGRSAGTLQGITYQPPCLLPPLCAHECTQTHAHMRTRAHTHAPAPRKPSSTLRLRRAGASSWSACRTVSSPLASPGPGAVLGPFVLENLRLECLSHGVCHAHLTCPAGPEPSANICAHGGAVSGKSRLFFRALGGTDGFCPLVGHTFAERLA